MTYLRDRDVPTCDEIEHRWRDLRTVDLHGILFPSQTAGLEIVHCDEPPLCERCGKCDGHCYCGEERNDDSR